MEQIVSKADGVPLFVEELTKAILESGLLTKDESSYQLSGPLPLLAIPLTLQDSLMARLDRLGPAKEIAQIGAAIGREFPYDQLRAVAGIDDVALCDALDRLELAELASSRGKPPKAVYTFKHALVQDAAYGTLLREPRRALHARIADVLESQFAEIAENQPELLAHHCTEAGRIEKAAGLWGKAGQRSLERSALVEAAEQLRRALSQIAVLPPTPALRREEIKLQVALIAPLIHVRGYAAPETKAAVERARLLIEQAEEMGEPQEDPLLLFSVLYGFWVANLVAFNGDVIRELAPQFLALAKKQGTTAPRINGHRMMGNTLTLTGDIVEGRAHYDQAIALYDPVEHRPLATRFGQDMGVAILTFRALALWLLGYPEAANADIQQSLTYAREIGQAATLLVALSFTCLTHVSCGNYEATNRQTEEAIPLADEKAAPFWKALGMMNQGWVLAQSGKFADAVQMLTSGIVAYRSTEARICLPLYMSYLAKAHAELGQFDGAWRRVGEAMTEIETTKETWQEAEVHRVAGEIALMSPGAGTAKAAAYFERALQIARQQQAKSWELRAAMSMARLWRDQGRTQQALELLTPVYGWFTEGFDTRDLKDAKALLEELQSAQRVRAAPPACRTHH
jgi:predicted ATPase